jgi:hypothetical protein
LQTKVPRAPVGSTFGLQGRTPNSGASVLRKNRPSSRAMNVLLLRVGIDLGCGGTLSPVFPDGTFEYILILRKPAVCKSAAAWSALWGTPSIKV